MASINSPARLARTAFHTSRLLDFCSEKELIAQVGHEPDDWPLVVLKELIDNGLDAAEEAGIAPEIAVRVDESGIVVEDNGPGLPATVIEKVLDFTVRVSSREAFIAPDRGAQGNALKTLVAMPFVLDGESGTVEIEAHGVRHTVAFSVDRLRQKPVIDHRQEAGLVKNGTRFTMRWPLSSSSILKSAEGRFLQIAADYTWVNPHLTLTVDWFGQSRTVEATAPSWPKWRPCDPTSAHWYALQHLERLVAAYLTHDQDAGRERTVREFVGEFRGLAGSAKQKRVLEATGLGRSPLSTLRNGDGLDAGLIQSLLAAMQANTAPVKPEQLGIIGKEHMQERFAAAGCQMESFQYKRAAGEKKGLPWVIEVAFGWCPQASRRRLVCGVNWSSAIVNPFRRLGYFGDGLDGMLTRQRVGPEEQVIAFVHLAHPLPEFTDRGKSAIASSTLDASVLTSLVETVTAKWTKQRRLEERHRAAQARRWDALTASRAMKIKEAAYSVMEEAYLKASANNTYPAKARQIMYAARGAIQELIEKRLDDRYFTQDLLPKFMAEHPRLTAGWQVVWDARGHLIEPHTGHSVPLGTAEVEDYVRRLDDPRWSDPSASMPAISTCGPSGRYGALLFIEKEGFGELFRKAKLAERYDLAIMSTKGMSVVASRRLVDHLCARYSIPLFVLHDFDVSGFTILRTLHCDTARYRFKNAVAAVDLGLRLADVEEWGLQSESVHHHQKRSSIRAQLEESGATSAEIDFLMDRRVELNAFTSDKLIEWIEAKLQAHGARKVIPEEKMLAEEYRRQRQSAYLREHFGELLERSRQHIAGLDVSAGLGDEVARLLQEEPALAWNDAVAEIAERQS